MKYVTLANLCFTLLWVGQLDAQSRKIPFVEHFSNTRCPVCNYQRSTIQSNLNNFNGDVNIMTIHRKYPSPSCPLYAFSQEDVDNREAVYANSQTNFSGTPIICVNSAPSHYSSFVDKVNNALENNQAIVGLNMEESGLANRKASLEVFNRSQSNMENLFVYAALVEKSVTMDIDNKSTQIHHVFRKFLGNQKGKGDPVGTLDAGDSKTIVLEGAIPSGLSASNLYVVAWVEERKPNGNSYDIIMHNSVSQTTSTRTNSQLEVPEAELSVFPNPASHNLHIRNLSEFTPKHYRIVAMDGQEIRRIDAHDNTIDISDLPSGQFMLVMENDQSRISRKFVKQ